MAHLKNLWNSSKKVGVVGIQNCRPIPWFSDFHSNHLQSDPKPNPAVTLSHAFHSTSVHII